ncbi:hypothetical protein P5P86_10340 [Nocardioides sp. BP30]|uniref:hypothetical protein n=1 Tax=Nocardioides sp. BP30 TaxID=3036374 RepID=UPI002468E2BC|nr:hypothetical protein [Nocardioides sp. BP30]WGL50366.1 hypothetical protein P5P86_10340 [Nocardioides sp. BP30]
MIFPGNVSWPSSVVTVKVPAHPDFVASIRAMSRSVAVLADLALEDAEELQMAVDESAILLLPLVDDAGSAESRMLTATFEVEEGCVGIVMSAPCRPGSAVDRTGMPWMMLTAIDAEVSVSSQGGEAAIKVTRRREDISS